LNAKNFAARVHDAGAEKVLRKRRLPLFPALLQLVKTRSVPVPVRVQIPELR